MNVLIVGGGGREHALAWKTAQSPLVRKVFVAPGNAGTAQEPGVENVPIEVEDWVALRYFALEHGVALTLVGPETVQERRNRPVVLVKLHQPIAFQYRFEGGFIDKVVPERLGRYSGDEAPFTA